MEKPDDGTPPLANPRHEIYAVERAADISEEDAVFTSGVLWKMRKEPAERVCSTKSQIARQILRRVDARLAVLVELEHGLDMPEHAEFLLRNKRATAELRWFKMVVEYGGVEPEEDSDGNLIPPPKRGKQATPSRGARGKFLPSSEPA